MKLFGMWLCMTKAARAGPDAETYRGALAVQVSQSLVVLPKALLYGSVRSRTAPRGTGQFCCCVGFTRAPEISPGVSLPAGPRELPLLPQLLLTKQTQLPWLLLKQVAPGLHR